MTELPYVRACMYVRVRACMLKRNTCDTAVCRRASGSGAELSGVVGLHRAGGAGAGERRARRSHRRGVPCKGKEG